MKKLLPLTITLLISMALSVNSHSPSRASSDGVTQMQYNESSFCTCPATEVAIEGYYYNGWQTMPSAHLSGGIAYFDSPIPPGSPLYIVGSGSGYCSQVLSSDSKNGPQASQNGVIVITTPNCPPKSNL
jgi:hypothetical protein